MQSNCDRPLWRIILDETQDATLVAEAERHLDRCRFCQENLDRFAQEQSNTSAWWRSAKESWLEEELPQTHDSESSVITIEIARELPDDMALEVDKVSLDFLERASHPEMLGRLGRYEVERVIGTGGMGVVLKAYDTELHRAVAIKTLAPHLANNASARKRFAREAQAAAAVLHPNVIPIHNVESEGKLPYLVMQCVNGCSLQARVDQHGPLTIQEVLRIAKQTASGLAAAHQQGLVHRDVKPANILMEENVDRVLLSDFGLARAVDDASLTRTGVVAGTPHYMSPEQALGESIQCSSDQFSLGSVMYFMLTGHPPFRAQGAMGVLNRICHEPHRSIDSVRHDVPIEVIDVIDRLLEKEPDKRFESMSELEAQLENLLSALQSGKISLRPFKTAKKELTAFSANWSKWSLWLLLSVAATFGLIAVTSRWMNLKEPIQVRQASPSVSGDVTVKQLEQWKRRLAEEAQERAAIDQGMVQIMQAMTELQHEPGPANPYGSYRPDRLDAEAEKLERAIQAMEREMGP